MLFIRVIEYWFWTSFQRLGGFTHSAPGIRLYLNDHYMASGDYIDHLESGQTPPLDCQYWVAPFVQEMFDQVLKAKRMDIAKEIIDSSAMKIENLKRNVYGCPANISQCAHKIPGDIMKRTTFNENMLTRCISLLKSQNPSDIYEWNLAAYLLEQSLNLSCGKLIRFCILTANLFLKKRRSA